MRIRALRRFWQHFSGWLTWGDPFRLRPELEALLVFTSKELEARGVRWWLEWGTLLGCVRHEDLIPWDYDLDAGVHADDLDRLRREMETARLPEGYCFVWDEAGGYGRFTRGEVWIDLVGYAPDAATGKWVPCLAGIYRQPDGDEDYYPDHDGASLMPLGRGKVGKTDYPVPHDPDALLRIWYGDYLRLDPVPLMFSALYHPLQTWRFLRRYRLRRALAGRGAAR